MGTHSATKSRANTIRRWGSPSEKNGLGAKGEASLIRRSREGLAKSTREGTGDILSACHRIQATPTGSYLRRPRITSRAPASRAKALPTDPGSISGTGVANAIPDTAVNNKAIPKIFIVLTLRNFATTVS